MLGQKIGQGLLLTVDPHVVVVPPKYFFHTCVFRHMYFYIL